MCSHDIHLLTIDIFFPLNQPSHSCMPNETLQEYDVPLGFSCMQTHIPSDKFQSLQCDAQSSGYDKREEVDKMLKFKCQQTCFFLQISVILF